MPRTDLHETATEYAPETVVAVIWARQIVTTLRTVAEDYQVSAALLILAEMTEYQWIRIVPVGPDLATLHAMHREREDARLAELEDEGPADSWPAWTDCLSAELVEC